MKKVLFAIVLFTLFASCQTTSNPNKVLSNKETRKEIMDTIANNSEMSKEMMEAMMTNKNCKMMMMGNHETMMKMIKDNPGMMQSMMSDMMETCKNDSGMMSSMCKSMMGNQQMMDMMQKMKGENKDKKMEGMEVKHH